MRCRITSLTGLGALLLMFSACKTTIPVVSSEVLPDSSLARLETIYLVKHDNDRDLNKRIADGLTARGMRPVLGGEGDVPAGADALLVYEDRWVWDLTNYLLLLKIDLRDPETNVLLATGSSNRVSLNRAPPERVVTEVLDAIFEGGGARSREGD